MLVIGDFNATKMIVCMHSLHMSIILILSYTIIYTYTHVKPIAKIC